MNDALGVEIREGDTVRVTSWGFGSRLTDAGRTGTVLGFGRSRVRVALDGGSYATEVRPIGPVCLSVLRRDGQPGLEGNRTVMT